MIDKESLLNRCVGEEELMRELLQDFLDRCEGERQALLGARDEIGPQAHRIKGLALNLSMEPLREKAAQLEKRVANGDNRSQALEELLTTLSATCEEARAILHGERDG